MLDREESLTSATVRFDISNISALAKWIEKYTSHSTQGKPISQTRVTENMKFIEEMNEIHLSVNGIYGYRRMTLNLKRRFGRNVNAKRVRRLMQVAGSHYVIHRKRPLYIRNRPQQTAENILNRDFNAAGPNQKWVTGITELKYGASRKA